MTGGAGEVGKPPIFLGLSLGLRVLLTRANDGGGVLGGRVLGGSVLGGGDGLGDADSGSVRSKREDLNGGGAVVLGLKGIGLDGLTPTVGDDPTSADGN